MNVPTGQYCPPSIGMVAAFKLESLAGIVGIRSRGVGRDTLPRSRALITRLSRAYRARLFPYNPYINKRAPTDRAARFIDDRSHSVSGRFSISTTRGQHHVPSSTLSASCVTRKHRAACHCSRPTFLRF